MSEASRPKRNLCDGDECVLEDCRALSDPNCHCEAGIENNIIGQFDTYLSDKVVLKREVLSEDSLRLMFEKRLGFSDDLYCEEIDAIIKYIEENELKGSEGK